LEESAERLEHLAQASWHAFADRYHWLGDADLVPVPEAGLLSASYAREIADRIRAGSPPPRSEQARETPWNYFARHAVHNPWLHEPQSVPAAPWSPAGGTAAPAGTTHVSVVDGQGMAVSITHTAANHCGAKVVCERTGLLFDAAMGWFNARPGAANSIAPGKRPLANMGPVLLTRGGRTLAAIGAPGGRRIINAVVQVVLNLVERGMQPAEALQAPRIDASGTALLASERLANLVSGLRGTYGEPILVSEQHEGYGYELARPVIALHDGQMAHAAVDPFSRGYARGFN
jgi:gamma-glutamyltranspeptidase/glutathione hydrolase